MTTLGPRELFAVKCMQALLHSGRPGSPELLAAVAVDAADAVLAELAKDPLARHVEREMTKPGGKP